jgi:hypothetical protein
MIVNPEEGDSDVLYAWMPRAIIELDAGWSLTAARVYFPDKNRPLEKRFVPVLLEILKKAPYSSSRSEAAKILGSCKIRESLPALEECVVNDKESTVRGACRHAYWEISRKIPSEFHPQDLNSLRERFSRPRTIQFYNKVKDDDPGKMYYLELKRIVNQYVGDGK